MDAPWIIELLGWLRATQGSRFVHRFRRQKTASLLAYLAFYRHRSHPRDALIELLWPETDPEVGRNRLSVTLSSLRRQLELPGVPPGAVILADHATVQLNPHAVTTDVAAFEAALQAGGLRLGAEVDSSGSRSPGGHAGSAVERIQRLTEAAQLYQGELLPGYFEEWVQPERERLAGAFLQALGQLVVLLEQREDLPSALSWAWRAVATDPLREESHETLIRLLAAAGQVEAARRQYRELGRLMEEQLGEAPAPAIREFVLSLGSRDSRVPKEALDDRAAERRREPDGSLRSLPSAAINLAPGISLPTGTVTFLMTDIEGPSIHWERTGEAFPPALASHHQILRQALSDHRGYEVKEPGEGFLVAFQSAGDALAAAVAAQQGLAAHPWPDEVGRLRVRMGLHSGDVEPEAGEYHGLVLHHAQRALAAGHGGQILATAATAAVLPQDLPAGVRLVELGIYRLRDVPGPERLFQIEYAGMEPQTFPPLNAEPAFSGTLPLSFNRFFGREEEITLLGKLLSSPERRLVTLMGLGGSGKTRLALELARQLVQAWRGAVWFVPLADLTEAQRVPEAVRDAMRLPRSSDAEPLEQVVGALSRQPSLLVLDNFEQLVEEGALLVQTLLERVPALSCVVTSRQRLGVPGEREFTVLPLPTPDEGEGGTVKGVGFDQADSAGSYTLHPTPFTLMQYPTVQLFVDRAQGVRPDFQVTAANSATVAGLCRRLEGIPLAIELAAARVGVLTPAQMLARLEERFELLVSRRRGAAPRHASLRAALDWSYELLTPELQRFFARLSVFRGGFTLEAAEVVGENAGALDDLEKLRECSLILAEQGSGVRGQGSETTPEPTPDPRPLTPDDEMRYRMLETLREYAAEQLDSQESLALARRHAHYYLGLAERAAPELMGADQAVWLDRLERDTRNLRAALAWSVESEERELGLQLGGALGRFWTVRGSLKEGREHLGALLSRNPESPTDSYLTARARAVNVAGVLAQSQGDYAAARSCFEESLTIQRRFGNQRAIGMALNNLGVLAEHQGDYPAARALYEESLEIKRQRGDRLGVATSLNNLGSIAMEQGDYAAAGLLHAESLALRRELGDRWAIAASLNHLGRVAAAGGDYAEARALYEEAMAIQKEQEDRLGMLLSLGNLADVAHREGDDETARALYAASLEFGRDVEDKPGIATCLEGLAVVAAAQVQPERAARLFAAATALRSAIGCPPAPVDIAEHERSAAAACVALGAEAFAAAGAAGRGLPLEAAIAYALEAPREPLGN